MATQRPYLVLVVLVVLGYSGVVDGQSVAPDDADSFCINHNDYEPPHSNEKVLLDTQNYRARQLVGAGGENMTWYSINYDGLTGVNTEQWVELTNVACTHNLFACGYLTGPQDNWLITQYINISDSGVRELTINISFGGQAEIPDGVDPPTEQSFSLWSYDTDDIDEDGRSDQNMYSDTGERLIYVSEGDELDFDTEHFDINTNGLYLAVVDRGSCTIITRLTVYYNVCPEKIVNLVRYPETVAPPFSNPSDRDATGTCIDNASQVSDDLALECGIRGTWEDAAVMCSCNPGYTEEDGSCIGCEMETYKLNQGNEECQPCPNNSNTTDVGSTMCTCDDEYYRADSENATFPCTAPPSEPRGLATTTVGSTAVTIEWSPPSDDGGRSDIFYTIIISGNSTGTTVDETTYTITDLIPATEYDVTVIAENGVSHLSSDTSTRRAMIVFTTEASGPTAPRSVELMTDPETGRATILRWAEPDELYGTLSHYLVLISAVNDSASAIVEYEVRTTSVNLDNIDGLSDGRYYVWVQAVTDIEAGALTGPYEYTRINDATSFPVGAIVGIVVGVVIVVIAVTVICAVLLFFLCLNRRKHKQYNGAVNYSGELELDPMTEGTMSRMYVDPRNYSDLNQAFEQNNIKEIPPKEITSMEEIGVGEFGIVSKAQWTPKGVQVAVKTLRGGATDEMRQSFLFEASVMGQFYHPNVIKLYGIISKIEPIMIVMEYLEKGSLDRYLQKNLDKIPQERQLNMCHGVARGMSYLARIGFVHRDLAARNVLLAKDETCKVADFGLARELVDNEYDVQRGGRIPVRWTAPEAISYRSFTTASDVWSYGVLMWEVFTYGETPYDGWDNHTVLDRLDQGERLRQPQNCSDEIYQVMLSCWNSERSERPSFDQLKESLEIMIYGKPLVKPKPANLQSPRKSQQENGGVDMSVEQLLGGIGMERYIPNFHAHKYYNVSNCYDMTEDTLNNIGVNLAGHQYKIIKHIRMKEEEMGTQ